MKLSKNRGENVYLNGYYCEYHTCECRYDRLLISYKFCPNCGNPIEWIDPDTTYSLKSKEVLSGDLHSGNYFIYNGCYYECKYVKNNKVYCIDIDTDELSEIGVNEKVFLIKSISL